MPTDPGPALSHDPQGSLPSALCTCGAREWATRRVFVDSYTVPAFRVVACVRCGGITAGLAQVEASPNRDGARDAPGWARPVELSPAVLGWIGQWPRVCDPPAWTLVRRRMPVLLPAAARFGSRTQLLEAERAAQSAPREPDSLVEALKAAGLPARRPEEPMPRELEGNERLWEAIHLAEDAPIGHLLWLADEGAAAYSIVRPRLAARPAREDELVACLLGDRRRWRLGALNWIQLTMHEGPPAAVRVALLEVVRRAAAGAPDPDEAGYIVEAMWTLQPCVADLSAELKSLGDALAARGGDTPGLEMIRHGLDGLLFIRDE